MKLHNPKFEITAVKPEGYPQTVCPEAAFVGRSNVGKSSLINTLLNRKNLARVGATPGKTREINFYNIDDNLFFVDLPGYGYANVSKEKQSTWTNIIETYLYTRPQLKMLIMLVDIRHEPSKDDIIMHHWVQERGLPYFIIATKSDKISRGKHQKHLSVIKKTLMPSENAKLIPFSASNRQSREDIWDVIEKTLLGDKSTKNDTTEK